MKKLSIKKNNEVVQHCNFDSDEAMQAFIQLLADQAPWGKPERWLQDSPMSPLSEEEKAKAIESRTVEVMGEQVTEYRLAAEYEVLITDLEQDPEYLLQKCYENRRKEYPPMEDYLDAVVKGDEVQKQEYVNKCLAVKAKYPRN